MKDLFLLTHRLNWKEDEEAILTNGCQCLADCCHQFSRSHYEVQRNQCAELSHELLDMVLMGQLKALNPPDKPNNNYMHQGKQVTHLIYCYFKMILTLSIKVCKTTFLFLQGIGKKRLFNIRSSLRTNGLKPR